MKIRGGFVSNSSSSSFIVIEDSNCNIDSSMFREETVGRTLIVNSCLGETDFGWEKQEYYDEGSKILFSYIQARQVDNDDWIEMLEDVITENINVIDVEWMLKDTGYVDHQSSSSEGMNTEMFKSKKDLRNFLFNGDSYIQTGNDNC